MGLELLNSREAELMSLAVAAVAVSALLLWSRGPDEADRRLALGVAFALTVVIGVMYALALALGWWGGAYFDTPIVVQAAILVTVAFPACVAWLAGYRWLAEHTRQSLQICLAISLAIVLAVAVAHRFNVGQGTILVGPDLAVVWEAALGVALLWLPILLYEALRHGVERVTLP